MRGVTLSGPSSLKTAKGIGIGSTLRELEVAYGAALVRARPGVYVLGESEGMVFDVGSKGTVAAIYWGRDAGP